MRILCVHNENKIIGSHNSCTENRFLIEIECNTVTFKMKRLLKEEKSDERILINPTRTNAIFRLNVKNYGKFRANRWNGRILTFEKGGKCHLTETLHIRSIGLTKGYRNARHIQISGCSNVCWKK